MNGEQDRERPDRDEGSGGWRGERDAAFKAVMEKYGISPRRREAAGLVCWGYADRGIAKAMHICAKTVQKHLAFLRKKFRVHNREDLSRKIRKEMGDEPPGRRSRRLRWARSGLSRASHG